MVKNPRPLECKVSWLHIQTDAPDPILCGTVLASGRHRDADFARSNLVTIQKRVIKVNAVSFHTCRNAACRSAACRE